MRLDDPESVSVVVPVFNEEPNLPALHREIGLVMKGLALPWELILVDDASDDGSAAVIDRLVVADEHVRGLTLDRRSGQSAALLAGFAAACGDVVVTLDADLQNDPADIPTLLDALPGHGAAIGWRRDRNDTWVRRMSSRIANGVRNRLTHETVRDTGCSLKAMRRHVLQHLPHYQGMHRFLPTLIKMEGVTVVERPVGHRPRQAGVSKYGIGNRLMVGIGDVMMVRWLQRRHVHVGVERAAGRGLSETRRPGGASGS